jgi:hypothetical protein
MAQVTLTFTIHKPWWTHLFFAGARFWAWCGLPVNVDRVSHWLAGHFKITAD